jgi:signal transduction histidine kinase
MSRSRRARAGVGRFRVIRAGRALRWAAVATLAFGVGSSVLAWQGYQGQVERVTTRVELQARGAAADLERYVQSRWWTLNGVASAPAIRSGDPAEMRPFLETLDPASFGFDAGISWIDREGWMRARTGDYTGPPIDFRDREHIRRALATEQPAVSAGLIGAVNAAPIVAFVVPVFDYAGALTGLLGSGIRLGDLSIGADSLRSAGGTEVVIVDAQGQVIAAAQPVNDLEPVDGAFPLSEMKVRGQGVMRAAVGPHGDEDRLVGFAVAPTAGWLVLVERSAAQGFGPATSALIATLAFIAGGTGLAIVLLLWAARRLEAAFRDQSDAYESEREARELLQGAVSKLERRDALREAFVGVMSHELRTPVTTIYGAAKLLSRSPDRPDARSLLGDIEEEAERLRRITEDLLVISRVEHGLMDFRPEPTLLQRLVPAVVEEVERRYPAAVIRTELPSGLPPVAADAGALRQVLDNLLANAVKYGEGAPIRLHADATGGSVRLSVEDGGPGIPEDELDRVFDLFFRSPRHATRAPGTGIGLYVARGLAEAMAGSLAAYPVEPRGTGFALTLPSYETDSEPGLERERPPSSTGTGGLVPAALVSLDGPDPRLAESVRPGV